MTDTPNLWERLDSDTDKSFAAFCIYRDMGDRRSLDKAAQDYYGKSRVSLGQFEKWSVDHNWQERVAAFDKHQDSLRQERNLERQKLIEDFAFDDYMVIRDAINKYKRDFAEVKFKGIPPHEVSNLVSLMKQADDYARRAVGLPDKINAPQRTEHTGADGKPIQTQQTNVNIAAESAHDASNILKQLAELGAIPSATSTGDNDSETQ